MAAFRGRRPFGQSLGGADAEDLHGLRLGLDVGDDGLVRSIWPRRHRGRRSACRLKARGRDE
eukprot:1943286-Pyramimonas_sp.AAC.1